MSIIINRYKMQAVKEGAGVSVNRVFGHNEVKEFDPFLMLDFFDVKEMKASKGFPWHPHKGMETISYFIRGKGEHQDSLGNKGIIGEGELQWMSAGRGIMHQEMPVASDHGIKGLQFWVNLPAEKKLKKPEYQFIKKEDMVTVNEKGSLVKVISGHYKGMEGPIDKSDLDIRMLHIKLDKDGVIQLKRSSDKNGFIFVIEGNGYLNDEKISAKYAYTLSDGDMIISADSNTELIYAEGRPIREEIYWYGPIVMNTREEVISTYNDIENGKFVENDYK